MLHHKRLVRVLDGLTDQPAFNIPSVDEIILKTPVSSGDHRLSQQIHGPADTSCSLSTGSRLAAISRAKHGVNDILQIMVSGRMETVLVILDKPDGDIRMGQGDFLHQCRRYGLPSVWAVFKNFCLAGVL